MGTEKAGSAARPPLVATPGHRRALSRARPGSALEAAACRGGPVGPRDHDQRRPYFYLYDLIYTSPCTPSWAPTPAGPERWTPRGHTCLPSWGAELFIGSAGVLKSRGSVTKELSQVKEASFKALLSACRCARQREMSPCSRGNQGWLPQVGPLTRGLVTHWYTWSDSTPGHPLSQRPWSPSSQGPSGQVRWGPRALEGRQPWRIPGVPTILFPGKNS